MLLKNKNHELKTHHLIGGFAKPSIIILYANHINLHVDCGCFGSFLKNKTANKIELYREIIFSTIAFLIFIETPKSDNK
ncbi:MAG TPA: hypothetical protein VKA34_05865 [Balneolales bacterium]|nr:hypothetical protein [Balneolales bacterium]